MPTPEDTCLSFYSTLPKVDPIRAPLLHNGSLLVQDPQTVRLFARKVDQRRRFRIMSDRVWCAEWLHGVRGTCVDDRRTVRQGKGRRALC